MKRLTAVAILAAFGMACQQTTPVEPSSSAATNGAAGAGSGIVMSATGDGTYNAGVIVDFSMNALAQADGSAKGTFRHTTVLGGQSIDFIGRVTCLAVDSANGRAWIAGVITANNSTHTSFTGAIHQVGKDIWFRVLDSGEGAGSADDRTTFVGFEGSAGIQTSAEYCQTKPWPDNNDRTNALLSGNLQVRP